MILGSVHIATIRAMPPALSWEPPSHRVAELIGGMAAALLEAPDEVFEDVDEAVAVLAAPGDPVLADPALTDAVRRSNRAGLIHWAASNVAAPGARVAPNVGPEALAMARNAVRHGFDQGILEGYRVAQNVAWRRWMALAFEVTADQAELRELLDVSARSIFAYVDETLAALWEEIERERAHLRRGTQAQRLEVVSLIVEGAPIGSRRASVRLSYELDRPHVAAVAWSDAPDADPALLEQAAEALARTVSAVPLTVVASESSLWIWVSTARPPDPGALEGELERLPGVRLALGPVGEGLAGFRRSHLDALATQRLLHRAAAGARVAAYDDVQVVALAAEDEERAAQFVHRTLGDLAHAAPELRETVRVYLREHSNAARTARQLYTHRNTVLARLARADELLPAPLDGRLLTVALALEIVRWLGPPAGEAAGAAAVARRA